MTEERLPPSKGRGTVVIGFLIFNLGGGILMESQFKVFGLFVFLFGCLMFLFGAIQNWIIVAKWKKKLNNPAGESSEEAGRQICELEKAS